jgi:phosphoglycolate phosphatase-like HAD superfamily hydrolase
VRHVVWDWNGTLFADLDAIVDATNVGLAGAGVAAIDREKFRRDFGRPVRAFNERLLGRSLTDEQWRSLDDAFHDHYRQQLQHCELADGAESALERLARAGVGQSLLSMWRHDELVELLTQRGLVESFSRIDGDQRFDGGSKADRLRDHLSAQRLDPRDVVLIGDTLDDAAAARAVDAQCLLVAEHSSHHGPALEAEAATVATVTDAAARIVAMLDGSSRSATGRTLDGGPAPA